jgi:hypothetical protein
MKYILWKMFAWLVSRKPIADYLIRRAMRTPYFHLDGYMERWWLLNRYDDREPIAWLPSIRIHHILREDIADHPHDHPWDARTIILRGGYIEKRRVDAGEYVGFEDDEHPAYVARYVEEYKTFFRKPGDTAPVLFGDYHHISAVTHGGAWTMFITFGYKGTWGFLVNGEKVPWRDYEKLNPGRV